MATLEKNVLMIKKEGQDMIIEYPVTKRDCIVDFPDSIKNPNALTVNVDGETLTYDGSSQKSIDIPLYFTDTEVTE